MSLTFACVDRQAQDKCEAMLDAVCDNMVERCQYPSHDRCVEEWQDDSWDCDEILDIADGYDECMTTLEETESCFHEPEVYQECGGVLSFTYGVLDFGAS